MEGRMAEGMELDGVEEDDLTVRLQEGFAFYDDDVAERSPRRRRTSSHIPTGYYGGGFRDDQEVRDLIRKLR